MADFLVKRGGPAQVRLIVPTDKGKATVTLAVTPRGAAGMISIPDDRVSMIDPRHARHLVRLTPAPAPAPEVEIHEDELDAEESKTIPATPDALKTAG